MPKKIYVLGSMRNPEIVNIDNALREAGYDPFTEWIAPGKDADDEWQKYSHAKGLTYKEAADGHHARNVFEFDYEHLMEADAVVAVYPAGKSAHVEMGWFGGFYYRQDINPRPIFILITEEPDRFDIMPGNFARLTGGGIVESVEELLEELKNVL